MDYHTCRTCLRNGVDLSNLFNHIINGRTLSEILEDCVQIKVTEDGILPYHICDECTGKLTSAWTFKELAIKSEQKLRDGYIRRKDDSTTLIKEEHYDDMYENIEPLNILNQNDMTKLYECVEPEHDPAPLQNSNYDTTLKKGALPKKKNGETNDSTIAKEEHQIDDKLTPCLNNITPTNNDVKEIVTLVGKHVETSEAFNCKEENVLTRPKDVEDSNQCSNHSTSNENLSNKSKPKIHCKKCNKLFSRDYYCKVHIYVHTGFKCNVCGKTFNSNYQLINHKTTEHKTQPHTCYICGKTFKTYLALRNHRTTHSRDSATHGIQKHECIICGKVFKTRYNLYYHHKTVHVEKKTHACTICNKEFAEKKVFTRHMLKHKEEWAFICEICGKSCPTHGNLKRHRTTHIAEKTIPCSTCGKCFSSDANLRRHLVWHTEDKAFTCDYCGKAFKTSFARKRHILVHTGERPYSCKICDKKFTDTAVLSRHMLTHTGETPFSCDKCPYQCKYKQQFDNHMRKHKEK